MAQNRNLNNIVEMPNVLAMVDELLEESDEVSSTPSIVNGNQSALGIPLSVKDLEYYTPFDGLMEGDQLVSFESLTAKRKTDKKGKKDKKKKTKSTSAKVKKELTPEEIKEKEERKARKAAERRAAIQAEAEEEARKEALREAKRKEKQKKEAENTLIKLISRRDYIKAKLKSLNPGKEKDSRMIAQLNIELKSIEEDISKTQAVSGIYLDKLEEGSRLSRFVGKVKSKIKSAGRSIKKFFKNNKEMVVGLSSVILPFLGGCLIKFFFG